MERSLCLLLGKEPKIDGSNFLMLTKPTTNFKALDAFTMNRFKDSSEVREYFQEQIKSYLTIKNGTNESGSIVIIEIPTEENEIPIKRRVLYMTVVTKVQDIISNDVFMRYLAEVDECSKEGPLKLFRPEETDTILMRYATDYSGKEIKYVINRWKNNNLKSSYYGTDRLRKVLKIYETWCHKNQIRMRNVVTEEQKRKALIKKEQTKKCL